MLRLRHVIGVCQMMSSIYCRLNDDGHYTFEDHNPENTTDLDLKDLDIETLDPSIDRLQNLQWLYLSGNALTSLPDGIGRLANLTTLWLNKNEITSLPESIGGLTNLSDLRLDVNKLTSLPKTMSALTNLTSIYLSKNPLKAFPGEVLAMINLKTLYMERTELPSLPDEIGNLTELTTLCLSKNGLTGLPQTMGNLKNLQSLDLDDNPLESFPEQILAMAKLTLLDLRNTGLHSIPDEIRNLTGLMRLLLHSNQLTSLPEGIFQLAANSIRFMNLTENNLPLQLQIRLRGAFADRVALDMDKVKMEAVEIDKEDVYLDLESKPLRWNYEKLRSLRQKPVPKSTLNEQGLMGLWEDKIAFYISQENKLIIEEFIHHLFNPKEEYKRWKMNEIHIPLAKNLLEAVMDELSKVKDDDEKIISNINAICEGLEHCPDRQIGEMMFVYYLLIGEVDPTSSLEEFAKYFVAQEKTRVFEIAMTPTVAPQNVHVLNYWKYELRDEVGFDFEFTTEFGTMGQDRFNGWYGNALRAFYTFFTPEYAINELTMKINSSNSLLNKALEIINGDDIAEDRKALMYLVSEDRVAHHKALELLKLSDDEGFRSETRERKYEQGMGSELFDEVLARLRAEDSSDEALSTKIQRLKKTQEIDPAGDSELSVRELFERTLEEYSEGKFIVPEDEEAIDFAGSITPEFTKYFLIKMGIIRGAN